MLIWCSFYKIDKFKNLLILAGWVINYVNICNILICWKKLKYKYWFSKKLTDQRNLITVLSTKFLFLSSKEKKKENNFRCYIIERLENDVYLLFSIINPYTFSHSALKKYWKPLNPTYDDLLSFYVS